MTGLYYFYSAINIMSSNDYNMSFFILYDSEIDYFIWFNNYIALLFWV